MRVEIFSEKVCNTLIEYVVVFASYKDEYILVRHKNRKTWEFPGGKVEKGESIRCAAKRELFEETGAIDFNLKESVYYNVIVNGRNSYGKVYKSEIKTLGKLPKSEIAEIKLTTSLNYNFTHQKIYEVLLKNISNSMK